MPGYIERIANQIADILMREGLDYTQIKAVFKQARAKARLHGPKEDRGSLARLTLEEELRFIDQVRAQGGQAGLILSGWPCGPYAISCTIPQLPPTFWCPKSKRKAGMLSAPVKEEDRQGCFGVATRSESLVVQKNGHLIVPKTGLLCAPLTWYYSTCRFRY